MRRTRLNPITPKKGLTPDQEARIKQSEILFTSARIFEMGVSAYLNRAGEYINDAEMETAAQILNTACVERKQARMLRDEVRKECKPETQYVARRRRKPADKPKRKRRGEANRLNA